MFKIIIYFTFYKYLINYLKKINNLKTIFVN